MSYILALEIAKLAHGNQLDKGGNLYIEHPIYVASKFENEDLKIVAVLHDVVEDTKIKLNDLRPFFKNEIIEAIFRITKNRDVTYEKYLLGVKSNNLARYVKIEDIKHNMDLSRIKKVQKKDLDRVEKYKKALEFLENIE